MLTLKKHDGIDLVGRNPRLLGIALEGPCREIESSTQQLMADILSSNELALIMWPWLKHWKKERSQQRVKHYLGYYLNWVHIHI